MADPNTNGRISVSEDRLRLILSEFKLELLTELQKYATAIFVEALDARVKALEIWQAGQGGEQSERRRVSASSLAWGALVVALIGVLAWLVYYATHP